ncbi:MAG TPA: TorF family putative porin [Burkholderiales bacterium]|nr:TorF family putative porin [Burkholderiales bacterium]
MKKLLLASAVAAAIAAPTSVFAQAATPAAAPASPHTFTANVGLFTDYRFRGISQTNKEPAIQGGFDYSHSSGFYAGIWSSNVYGNQLAAGGPTYAGGSQEIDTYAGYKFGFGDFAFDVGFLRYWYPGAKWFIPTQEKFTNDEIYGSVNWKWFTAKYSYGLSNFFGYNQNTNGANFCGVSKNTPGIAYTPANAPDGCAPANGGSHGSGYLDLSGAWELAPTWNLQAHWGHQWVANYGKFNYSDYKLGITKDWAGVTWGAAVIGTDGKKPFYRLVTTDGSGTLHETNTGDTTVVLSVTKTF